jgi:hypothetical protein
VVFAVDEDEATAHTLTRKRRPERTPVMSESLGEWWFSLQAWWQELTPDSRGFLRGVAVLLGAFLAGQVLGRMACRRLRARDFDASLRAPWLPSAGGGRAEARPFTPTGLVSGLVRCTAWGAGVWWLATEQGWAALARTLEWAAGRVWSLAAVLIVALYLARFLAGQVIELLQSAPLSEKLDGWLPRASGGREPRGGSVAALAGTGVYGVAFLLVLLVAADLFGWALTGGAVAAAWSFLLHAVTAGTAMLLGWLGYRWVGSLTFAETEAAPPARAVHYAALAILTGTTLLAISLLAATLQGLVGVAIVLLLAFVFWPLRGYVPDVWAGLLLKGQKVKHVRLDGELAQIGEVGLLTTRLHRQEEQLTRRNRLVLEAHLQGASKSKDVAP